MRPGHSKTSNAAKLRRRLWRAGREMLCHWCGIRLDLDGATVDHLEPGNDNVEHLVWACGPCNGERGRQAWFDGRPCYRCGQVHPLDKTECEPDSSGSRMRDDDGYEWKSKGPDPSGKTMKAWRKATEDDYGR